MGRTVVEKVKRLNFRVRAKRSRQFAMTNNFRYNS